MIEANKMNLGQFVSSNNQQENALFLGIELAKKHWEIAFSDGNERHMETIQSGNFHEVCEYISIYKEQFNLSEKAAVISCYEAGRDGFWVDRVLREQMEVHNLVVDPASIESTKRSRETKTDRLDARKLVRKLIQFVRGDREVFSVCRVPSRDIQDKRQINRELKDLKEDRARIVTKIKSLLAVKGIQGKTIHQLEEELEELEGPKSNPLGEHRKRRIKRLLNRYRLLTEQIKELEDLQKQHVRENHQSKTVQIINHLRAFTGIALNTAWQLSLEAFAWRAFQNRGEIGGCFGLDPSHYNTGETEKDQGISKAGSTRLRSLAIQVAWNWVQYQPDSQLTRWFKKKFNQNDKDDKKRGIVALARKLMIRLYKWATDPKAAKPWGSVFNKKNLLKSERA